MGRLSPLRVPAALAVALIGAACDAPSTPPAPSGRSEQVVATGAATTVASASAPAPSPHVTKPARVGKLCDGDANAKGRTLARVSLPTIDASGAPQDDGFLPPGRGQWTWVNFWAAWCGPCKEEMPRLASFQDRLEKAGAPIRFVFVSLDDDARQLQGFLQKQPANGVRSSLWLGDGPKRSALLAGLKMKSEPELPEQALVDPTGRVRCFVQGAIEDADYAEIAGLVGR